MWFCMRLEHLLGFWYPGSTASNPLEPINLKVSMDCAIWQFKKMNFFKDFLMWTIFLKSLLNLLQYCFCFIVWFFFNSKACGILAPLLLTAAKSLQSCPTLCDPIDSGPPAYPVPGILQARILEWVAISFSNAWWKVKVKSLSPVRLWVTPWTAAHQAPPSMEFSRQEYWSGVPSPSPLSFPTRDWTCTLCIGRWSLNHRTTREVPPNEFLIKLNTVLFDEFNPVVCK